MQFRIQDSLNFSDLGRQLKALPDFDPPPGGWMRLQRERLQRRRRQWAGVGGFAMAACLVLAIGLPRFAQPPVEIIEQPRTNELQLLMARSRDLEQRLAVARPQVSRWSGAQAVQVARLQQGLSLVDYKLNQADPETARALWQRRVQLMNAMVELHQQPAPALVQAAYQY